MPDINNNAAVEPGEYADLVERLVRWLRERARPNSGIDYQATSISLEDGWRSARCTLFGADADFAIEYFHGRGAGTMAAAIETQAAEIARLRAALERIAAHTNNTANAYTCAKIARAALQDGEAGR